MSLCDLTLNVYVDGSSERHFDRRSRSWQHLALEVLVLPQAHLLHAQVELAAGGVGNQVAVGADSLHHGVGVA